MVGCPSPVVESPSEPGSLISRWLEACENAYFATNLNSQFGGHQIILKPITLKLLQRVKSIYS